MAAPLTMRLFLASLFAALLLCLPYIALHHDMDFPLAGIFMLPVMALHNIANITHEAGHTLWRWLFGYPAWPTLDFEHGGGYTFYAERSMATIFSVWGLMAATIAYCKHKGFEKTVPALYCLMMAHIIIACDEMHEALILYMGHGMEVVMAAGLVYLGLLQARWHGFWRGVLMTSGLYIALKNAMLCLGLLTSGGFRFGYTVMKGGRGLGDFDRIAEIAWWGKDAAIAAFLVFIPLCIAGAAALAHQRKNRDRKPVKKLRAEAKRLTAGYRPRRVFLTGLTIAAVGGLPYGVHQFNGDLPLWILIPLLPLSEGLHYTNVLFHEMGHALAYWLFGTPAFTLLDAQHGGGVTYNFGRSHALLAGLYVLLAAGGALLARKGDWRGAAWLGAFAALHVAFLWHGWDLVLAAYAGHGLEVIIGGFFILYALDRQALHSMAERCAGMVFGLYLFAHTGFLCLALCLSNERRLSYGVQKGKAGSADIDKAAQFMGVSIETAAIFLGLFLAGAIFATLWILRQRRAF